MLIATPAIIWSTRNVTTNAANMNPNPPPTKIAKINPIKLPKIEPKRAPANAPANSIPSIPMFITATLSHIIPAIAAKAIGTALTTVACSIPVRENDLPAVAQTKKAAIAKKKLKATKIVKFLGAFIIILPPKKAINKADRPIKLWAGRIKLGRANGSVGLESLKVACPSIPRPKNKYITNPKKISDNPIILDLFDLVFSISFLFKVFMIK